VADKPEERARAEIDRLLAAAGWSVQSMSEANIHAARGVALLRTPLPVVGINSKEIPEARCFTVLHEVAHLMLAAGHEELPAIQENRSGADWDNVERFAEIAAIGRNGRPFTQLVLEALSANRITSVTAARYLDLKFEHFDKLRAVVRDGVSDLRGDD